MRHIVGCSETHSAAEYKLLNWEKITPDDKGVIYWHVANFPATMDKFKTLFALQTCFMKWQEAFDGIEPIGRAIELKSTDDWHQAHIRIYFLDAGKRSQTIEISDGTKQTIKNAFPFDGTGGVLAHRVPNSFDLYFDASEQWSEIHKFEKLGEKYVMFVQLWQVAMHELGHMFDIGHATDPTALMFPTYDGQHITITPDDMAGLTSSFSKTKTEVMAKTGKAVNPTVVAIDHPNVEHIQGKLPAGTKPYNKRDLSQVRQIVVHHSADNGTPESIAKYHVNHNKWPGIGYHFLINKEGKIFQCHDLDVISFNVADQNTKTIGICVIGNFEEQTPTDEQVASLTWLIDAVKAVVGELPVFGHRQKGTTLCPGKNLFALIPTLDG